MNEKLSITLTTEMVALINRRVEAGDYASTSELLREAMRVWMRQEEEHQERLATIRAKVKASLEDTRPRVTSDDARQRVSDFLDRHR